MKPTKDLYNLIKSLTGSEKRYFKVSASAQKGNKNYLRLFDIIDSQNSFDENSIRVDFKDEMFAKNLTVTKNYLHKLIFKWVILFHNEKSIDARLSNMLGRCKLMYEKSLIKEFFKAIENGKQMAYKYERFSYLLEFIQIEKYIMKKDDIGKKDANKIYEEETVVTDKIRNINTWKKAVSNLFRLTRTVGVIRDKKVKNEIDNIVSVIESDQIANSVRAKESHYLAKFLECRLKGNHTEAIQHCKKRYELIKKHPGVFSEYLVNPELDSLEFYIYSALRLRKFKTAKNIFTKYKKTIEFFNYDEVNFTVTDFEMRLFIAIENEDKKVCDRLIPEIERFLIENKGRILINAENSFYYNICKYYFVTGKYERALMSLNNYMNSKYWKSTSEFESSSKILNILIHYELGNYKLLHYMIPSTKKYLNAKGKLYKYESLILKSVLRLIRLKDEASVKKNFKLLYKESIDLKKDTFEKNAFEYLDLSKWARNRMKV